MGTSSEIAAYNNALVETLRATDPQKLREFAAQWGARLQNQGLLQLAEAPDDTLERRMWMMIRDRPDLADLHERANEWLTNHS